jgi:hypothetical protein
MTDQPDSSAAFVMLAVWRVARHILAETSALHPPFFHADRTAAALADEQVSIKELDLPYFQRMFTRLLPAGSLQKGHTAPTARQPAAQHDPAMTPIADTERTAGAAT